MRDRQKLEAEIVSYFQSRGYRPHKPLGQLERFTGEWIVNHGNKPINLTELASILCDDDSRK